MTLNRQPGVTQTSRWRVTIVPHTDTRKWWKRMWGPRKFHWTRDVSYREGRWWLDGEGYAETITQARRRAMRSTWGLYAHNGKRMEIEYAIAHPKYASRDLQPGETSPELLERRS